MTVLSCEEWHVKDKRSESQFNLTVESIKEKYLVVFKQVYPHGGERRVMSVSNSKYFAQCLLMLLSSLVVL